MCGAGVPPGSPDFAKAAAGVGAMVSGPVPGETQIHADDWQLLNSAKKGDFDGIFTVKEVLQTHRNLQGCGS